MRIYSVRTLSSTEPVIVEADQFSSYSSGETVDFAIKECGEHYYVASFKKSDVVSVTSIPKPGKK